MDKLLFSYADPTFSPIKRGFIRAVEAATGQPRLKRLYLATQTDPVPGESFWQAAVRSLNLAIKLDTAQLAKVPKSGPVVFIANHPYGVLDGLVISWLAEQVRPDFLVLTHSALLRAPEAAPFLLPVDFTETAEARATNLASRAKARRHLDQGGAVVVFPAGGVSTSPDKLGRRPATDAPWQPFTAQLIQRAKATAVPIFFDGQNSRLFQVASHLSLALRLSLLFKETRDRIGTELRLVVGDPLPFESFTPGLDRRQMVDELRARTYALAAELPAATPAGIRVRRRAY